MFDFSPCGVLWDKKVSKANIQTTSPLFDECHNIYMVFLDIFLEKIFLNQRVCLLIMHHALKERLTITRGLTHHHLMTWHWRQLSSKNCRRLNLTIPPILEVRCQIMCLLLASFGLLLVVVLLRSVLSNNWLKQSRQWVCYWSKIGVGIVSWALRWSRMIYLGNIKQIQRAWCIKMWYLFKTHK